MSRPVVLLPPSKGKADGGTGRAYVRTIARRHPLAAARRTVLGAAVDAASALDDAGVTRLAGVRASQVDATRSELAELAGAATLPAHLRYTGIVHGNARLAALDPATSAVDVRIVSALLGLVALDEPVPAYRLEFAATLPPLGGLATYWRERLAGHLGAITAGVRVWDLLPGEHARMWPLGLREARDVVTVRFVRPDGRAANAARTKVAKGRMAAWLTAAHGADPAALAREADLGDGWSLETDGTSVTATSHL